MRKSPRYRMATQNCRRYAVTIPESTAAQIEQVCKLEGRNRP